MLMYREECESIQMFDRLLERLETVEAENAKIRNRNRNIDPFYQSQNGSRKMSATSHESKELKISNSDDICKKVDSEIKIDISKKLAQYRGCYNEENKLTELGYKVILKSMHEALVSEVKWYWNGNSMVPEDKYIPKLWLFFHKIEKTMGEYKVANPGPHKFSPYQEDKIASQYIDMCRIKKYKYKAVHTPADGDSLFHAVDIGLNGKSSQIYQLKARSGIEFLFKMDEIVQEGEKKKWGMTSQNKWQSLVNMLFPGLTVTQDCYAIKSLALATNSTIKIHFASNHDDKASEVFKDPFEPLNPSKQD